MRSRRKSIANISRGIDPVRVRRNGNAQTANRFRRGLRRARNGDVVLDEDFVVGTVNRLVGALTPSTSGTSLSGGGGGGGGGGDVGLAINGYTSVGASYVIPLTGTTLVIYLTDGLTPYSIISGNGVVRCYDATPDPYDVPLIVV